MGLRQANASTSTTSSCTDLIDDPTRFLALRKGFNLTQNCSDENGWKDRWDGASGILRRVASVALDKLLVPFVWP